MVRPLVVPLSVIIAAVAVIGASTGAEAKTFITISPQSGPTGTTVEVTGENFGNGEVRIELALAGALPEATEGGTFIDEVSELPATFPVAEVISEQGLYVTKVTLPPREEISQRLGGDTHRVDILAVQPLRPGHSRSSGFFVTGRTFTFTSGVLPSADTSSSSGLPSWPLWASLGVAGLALLATSWRLRRIR